MKLHHFTPILVIQLLLAANAQAVPFGALDPDSLAMGGAGVALATGTNASFFNPAMLARYSVRKEKAQHSRFIFPQVTARYSETLRQMDDFKNSDLDTNLTNAIANFNATASTTNAQAVADAGAALQSGLNQVSSGPFDLDAQAGFVIGIPSRHQGGAIVYDQRLVGDGLINQTAADRALLNAYIEGLTFVASGGTQGVAHPELFDAGGNLIDQTGNLTSTARGTAILMSEVGMSFAGAVHIREHAVGLGITPKYVKVNTYDISANATDNSLSTTNELEHDWAWNLDLGAETTFGKRWRAGLVLKNLVGRDYETGLGNQVHIGPQLRGGVAWLRRNLQLGLDLDLIPNRAIGEGDDSQVLAFGSAWRIGPHFRLMGGLQRNLRATGDQKTALYSLGMKVSLGTVQTVLSYAYNGVERAAGWQFGAQF